MQEHVRRNAAFRNQLFLMAVYGTLFFLPWQTRYILGGQLIGGEVSQYGVFSIYIVEVLLIVGFLVGQRLKMNHVHRWPAFGVLILLVGSFATIPFSTDMTVSLAAFLHVLAAAALFVVLLDRRIQVKPAMAAFVLGLIGPSVLAFFQFVTGASPAIDALGLAAKDASELGVAVVQTGGLRILRAYGSFPHPNIFGGYLAVGLLFVIALGALSYKHDRYSPYQMLAVACTPILSLAMVFSFSRSAWVGLVVGILLSAGLILWRRRDMVKPAARYMLLAAVGVGLSAILFVDPVLARFNPDISIEQNSIDERASQLAVFPEIAGKSILMGVGVGTYTFVHAAIEPGLEVWEYQPVHNAILLMLAEIGIVGLVAVLVWVASVDSRNYRSIWRGSAYAMFAIGPGAAVLVFAMVDHYLWSLWSGLALLAVVMGVTVRLSAAQEP